MVRRGSRIKLHRFYSFISDFMAAVWAPVCGGTRALSHTVGHQRSNKPCASKCYLQSGPPFIRPENKTDSSRTKQWSLVLSLFYNRGKKKNHLVKQACGWMLMDAIGPYGDAQLGGTRQQGVNPAAHPQLPLQKADDKRCDLVAIALQKLATQPGVRSVPRNPHLLLSLWRKQSYCTPGVHTLVLLVTTGPR